MRYYVEVTHIAYPLSSGWATEMRVDVRDSVSASPVATAGDGAINKVKTAMAIAAALSDAPIEEIEVRSLYYRREHRNPDITIWRDPAGNILTTLDETEHTEGAIVETRRSPTISLAKEDFDKLIWPY